MHILPDSIRIFSPGTTANVSCGFDVLGFAVENPGDEMVVRKTNKRGVFITRIEGPGADLIPYEAENNVAGVAALSMLKEIEVDHGFEIEIYKGIKPGSGLGSSAASSAGAVFGMNELLGRPFTNKQLVKFAMEGEGLISGAAHADNVAPALMGGFALIRTNHPLDLIEIPVPEKLHYTVIHPQIEVKTSVARGVLPKEIPLKLAVEQWGNVGALVAGLLKKDYALIGRALTDVIVEPARAGLIPHYYEVKKAALEAGALGACISGSGPSIFALSDNMDTALKIKEAMTKVYSTTGIDFDVYANKINPKGMKILD